MANFPHTSGDGEADRVGRELSDPPLLPPPKPGIADCCGEGCARCVFDIYEEALARFEIDLAAWRVGHAGDDDNQSASVQQE